MARISVRDLSGNGVLTLTWKEGEVSLLGDSDAEKLEWGYLQSRGLYGKYGHSLNLNDCLLTDLAIAIGVIVGEENLELDGDAKRVLSEEVESERKNPIPQGAQT